MGKILQEPLRQEATNCGHVITPPGHTRSENGIRNSIANRNGIRARSEGQRCRNFSASGPITPHYPPPWATITPPLWHTCSVILAFAFFVLNFLSATDSPSTRQKVSRLNEDAGPRSISPALSLDSCPALSQSLLLHVPVEQPIGHSRQTAEATEAAKTGRARSSLPRSLLLSGAGAG